MTQKPMSLSEGMKISDAVRTMLSHHISSAPVLTASGKLIGQISEVFLLKLFILASKKGNENQTLKDHSKSLVSVTTVKEKDPIDEVVKQIINSPSHRALVLDDHGHLRGIISPKDILRILVGEDARSGSLLNEFAILQDRLNIARDQLQATQSQLKSVSTVIEKSAFMFHSVDSKGKIVIANERIHQELGYQPNELVGKAILDLYPSDLHKSILDGLKKLIDGEEKEIKTYSTYIKKDGKPLRVEIVSRSIVDANNQFLATSTLSRILDSEELLRTLHGVYDEE